MSTQAVQRQKLAKRFERFLELGGDALEDTAPLLPAKLREAIARLRRPVTVAFAGPFGAHHHALAEAIVDELHFDDMDLERLPLLRILQGERSQTTFDIDGVPHTREGHQLSSAESVDAITIETRTPLIADVTVLPYFDKSADRAAFVYGLVDDIDIIVWASRAHAPWQPNEARIWFTVPDELKHNSVLAITYESASGEEGPPADHERLGSLSDDFAETVAVDVDTASPSALAEQAGLAGFRETLASLIARSEDRLFSDAAALKREINLIPIGSAVDDSPAPAMAARSHAASSGQTPPAEPHLALIYSAAERCDAALGDCDDDFSPLFESIKDAFESISLFLKRAEDRGRAHAMISERAAQASELLELLSYENDERAAIDAAALLYQLSNDLMRHYEAEPVEALAS